MIRYTITFETPEHLNPGNRNHLGAILMNPATKDVTIDIEKIN